MTKQMLSILEAGEDLVVSEKQIAWETVRDHKAQHLEYIIDAPESACEFLEDVLSDSPVELLYAVALDSSNRFLGCTRLASGTVDRAAVYPRLLVSFLLSVNATACILSHNHPGGRQEFSAEDLALSKRIGEILQPMDIRLLDHVLFVQGETDSSGLWMSMTKEGLL